MKTHRPTTPSQRQNLTIDYRGRLSATEPRKALTRGFRRAVGRNRAGRITVRHQGGGHKRLYREIDFKYDKREIPARVETVEYDPNRSGLIGLLLYADGERRYTLLPAGLFIYNLEVQPEGGAKLVRSAGNFAQVLGNDAGYATVQLPSSEVRRFRDLCWVSVGTVSNEEQRLINIGKAGRSRWLGIRPTVRGSAMNPVDHPSAGGEGRRGPGLG